MVRHRLPEEGSGSPQMMVRTANVRTPDGWKVDLHSPHEDAPERNACGLYRITLDIHPGMSLD
jgi:hypothetical protein